MHSASQSPRPADSPLAEPGHSDPERGDFLGAMRASWDDWVPVATTGWGAAVLIAPLLALHALVWALSGRRLR